MSNVNSQTTKITNAQKEEAKKRYEARVAEANSTLAASALPEGAASSSASGAETADPPNIKSRLILVQEQKGKNGEQNKYIATVVKKETSMSGLTNTPNAKAPNSTLISRNGKGEAAAPAASKGGRRKRRTHHKRTHKSHKRSHKSHKRIHRR